MKYKKITFRENTLCHGDCLEILQKWTEQGHRVDLIYLDPPFNSNANYNILYGKDAKGRLLDERAQFVAFKDTWHWSEQAHERVENLCAVPYQNLGETMQGLKLILGVGGMLAYISYMAERLVWMREILQENGSIYLHCDPTASHYLKTILDCIFGKENFRNEIVWTYRKWTNTARYFQRNHDIIFLYAKTKNVVFNKQYGDMTPAMQQIRDQGYNGGSNRGKKILRVYDKNNPKAIAQINSGKYDDIYYVTDIAEGAPISDYWDIPIIGGGSKERLGYPTQKPLALLELIVKASSNEGDIVLDPFCGCGTTAAAAWKLKRKFIGIDISPYAVTEVCRRRLKNAEGVSVQGLPMDMKSATELGNAEPFVFEQWAVSCLPGFMPNEKQTGDGGIDGRGVLLNKPLDKDGKPLTKRCVAQVKVGSPTPDAMRALLSQVAGGYAAIGIFITLEKLRQTRTMREVINKAGTLAFAGGTEQHPRMVFWSIEEYFAGVFPKIPERGHPITGKSIAQTEITSDSLL